MYALLDRIRASFLPREAREALRSFIQNYHWGENLSAAQAIRRMENGVLELVYDNGQHAANGLAVTKDGYFITSQHCVEDDLEKMLVRTGSGREYPVVKVCRSDPEADIALVKADIPGKAEPLRYRFHDRTRLNGKDVPVVVITRWDGRIDPKGGTIDGRTASYSIDGRFKKSHLHVQCRVRRGDSGGMLVTAQEGQLAGVVSSCRLKSPNAYCTTWEDVLRIIWEWCR